ncbi:MAG TPA: hypothetical protein VLH15_03745 [Dehalococcoidales bacterium]|nr:hypothetical protein [Dehalococcoidales bacterium]
MRTILTIAKWEVLRLRSRFGGKSRVVILPVILLAIVLSFTIYHQDFSFSKGIYTIGIESGSLIIGDARFKAIVLDQETGRQQLANKKIDLYLYGNTVLMRNDDRSQYAAGSLKKYLENRELNRIAAQYTLDKAFPLRIVISYPDSPELETEGRLAEAFSSDLRSPDTSDAMAEENILPFDQSVNGVSESSENYPSINAAPGETNSGVSEPFTGTSIYDAAVSSQLEKWQTGGQLPEFKAQFTSENEIIIPSLMTPPMPLAQVILAFLYVIPMFFISVFFTSSFTEEKTNRKLVILLSSPVTRLQVIFGKMLPYYIYSLLAITGVTIILGGNVFLALAIFLPVMLFVFAIYLMVALTYRTFKDQTFFSVLALSVITVYLVVPAMFAGVSNLSYASPLTLAVQMFRGESFTLGQYLIGTIPLYLVFFLAMYIGRQVFTEEFLMGFKPLRIKAVEAIYLAINKQHLNYSIFILSILLIPMVFAAQLVAIVIVSNLPVQAILLVLMVVSIVIEEIAKSAGIYALIRFRTIAGLKQIVVLAGLSALGFWAGEKLLVLLAASIGADSGPAAIFLGSGLKGGWMLVVPLVLHFITTLLLSYIASFKVKRAYILGILSGTVAHSIYNFAVLYITGAIR